MGNLIGRRRYSLAEMSPDTPCMRQGCTNPIVVAFQSTVYMDPRTLSRCAEHDAEMEKSCRPATTIEGDLSIANPDYYQLLMNRALTLGISFRIFPRPNHVAQSTNIYGAIRA